MKFFTRSEHAAYAKAVEMQAVAARPQGWAPLLGPVRFSLIAFFHLKGASSGWFTGDPDLSNLTKLVEDALEGIGYENDNQIAAYGDMQKKVTSLSHEEGVWVSVESLERPRAAVTGEGSSLGGTT